MFSGSNCCLSLGSQLCPALCAGLEGTQNLLEVETTLIEILGGKTQAGFREELTSRLSKLGGISFARSDCVSPRSKSYFQKTVALPAASLNLSDNGCGGMDSVWEARSLCLKLIP